MERIARSSRRLDAPQFTPKMGHGPGNPRGQPSFIIMSNSSSRALSCSSNSRMWRMESCTFLSHRRSKVRSTTSLNEDLSEKTAVSSRVLSEWFMLYH